MVGSRTITTFSQCSFQLISIRRTKQKEVYVVQTKKRPVPLEHYLYTGNSNKTSNELFLILDRKGKFVIEGYRAAVQAKKSRSSKADENYGAKGTRQGNPKQVFFGKE